MSGSADEPAITLLLQKWQQGDSAAFDELARYVYDDCTAGRRLYAE